MLIPSPLLRRGGLATSLSRRVNANSQHARRKQLKRTKLIKKGEC